MQQLSTEETKSAITHWLIKKWPSCSDINIISLKEPEAKGNSAQTYIVKLEYTKTDQAIQKNIVIRRQLEGYDIFLESSLELPYNVMRAVGEHSDVPVPGVLGLEFDRSILGSPFLAMEAIPGKVISQSPNYNVKGWLADLPKDKQSQVWLNAIKAMAAINRIELHSHFDFLKKPEYGKPGIEQYLGSIEAWYKWATNGRDYPVISKAMRYLRENLPADIPACVLWGDSHASNVIYSDDLSVAAIIDWEASNLGAPEIDFGYWLFFDELYAKGAGVERLAGLPDSDEMASCYEAALGRPIRNLKYFEIMGALRFAIVLVRFVDRMIALKLIGPDSAAAHSNPATHILAEKMGIAPPGDINDFLVMNSAAGKE